jgi:hypothetical protein
MQHHITSHQTKKFDPEMSSALEPLSFKLQICIKLFILPRTFFPPLERLGSHKMSMTKVSYIRLRLELTCSSVLFFERSYLLTLLLGHSVRSPGVSWISRGSYHSYMGIGLWFGCIYGPSTSSTIRISNSFNLIFYIQSTPHSCTTKTSVQPTDTWRLIERFKDSNPHLYAYSIH